MNKTFMDDTMLMMNTTSNYQFSGVKADELGATEYTLVSIVQDVSGSVEEYKDDMEKCLATVIESCQKSPRVENLMIRLVTFNQDVEEVHGFKLLGTVSSGDYEGILFPDGYTALFDAVHTSVEATGDYGKVLADQDLLVNAIIFIVTDGMNNRGARTPASIKKLINKIMRDENLESITVVLIGVGTKQYSEVKVYLEEFKNNADINQYVEIDETTPSKLAKLANFISRSVSSTSQALGSGSQSQLLNI